MPSANVDLMPTFLGLLGIPLPSSTQGRELREAIVAPPVAGAPPPPTKAGRVVPPALRVSEHTARTPDGRYAVTARMSILRVGNRDYRYFDGTTVTRRPAR